MGNSCYVGNSKEALVKLDFFYTETFVYPIVEVENIRMISLEEIVAMGEKRTFGIFTHCLNTLA